MRDLQLRYIAIFFSFILLACQDTPIDSETPIDKDMEQAWVNAESFLSNSRMRGTDSDVTVIKYQSELEYKTNTNYGGYEPIDEMTVTAETLPGGFIFWHAGGGVKRLLGIEMDEDSQELVGEDNEPFEIIPGHFWVLWIPADIQDEEDEEEEEEDDDIYLKYDIVYETYSGDIVRLDPKIQIKNAH